MSAAGRPLIFDVHGKPMMRAPRTQQMAMGGNAFHGPGSVPYDAASYNDQHMAAWQPSLWSADTEINPYRDRIVSRVRDAARNDGWVSGGLTRILDNAIGANFRPVSKPDHRILKFKSGANFDSTWAHEFGTAVDAHYRSWANDPGFWCDITRAQNLSGIFYTGFRHNLVDGDALAMIRWEPSRLGEGRASYCTAVQGIDPDRLSNLMNGFDTKECRGGVYIDGYGAATAYSIRQAHQGDWYNAAESLNWIRVPRETAWGRPVIIHYFDKDRFGGHRGVGVLTPVLQRLKMLIKYDGTELDAAIVNAIFSAYLESPFDHDLLQDALGEEAPLGRYQDARMAFHDQRRLMLNGVRMPTLFPGEKLSTVNATRPASNFGDFQAAMLRNVASAMGISAQQLSQNWSDVNYSSARAALLEAWKTLERRRAQFVAGFSHQIFLAWLEESFESDGYPLPRGAPSFISARAAYGKARWIGPAKGWVDPVAEKEGAWLGLEIGLSNLEDEAADQGIEWLENLDQLEVEKDAFTERGLERPAWMGSSAQAKPAPIPTAPKPGKQET